MFDLHSSFLTYRVVFIKVLILLVNFPHVHHSVLHLLQSPDLLPLTFTADLDGWLTQYGVSL